MSSSSMPAKGLSALGRDPPSRCHVDKGVLKMTLTWEEDKEMEKGKEEEMEKG